MTRLSPREAEVAALVNAGRRNADIAAELAVGPETVKSHLKSIFRKLDIGSRHEIQVRLKVDDGLRAQVLGDAA